MLPKNSPKAQADAADSITVGCRPRAQRDWRVNRKVITGVMKSVERRKHWSLLILLVAGCCVLQANATRFQAQMDESVWLVDATVFACSMSHDIPFYGRAVFQHRAGESAQFQLRSSTPRLESGKASLVSAAPVWHPQGKAVEMGYVPVKRGDLPVVLDAGYSQQVLAELHAGREVIFTRAPWYGASESLRVVLSSVNFQAAYRQYLACLATLLPVNFEQIRRTAIYFPSGSDELDSSELQKLDNIALYVKADASVEAFYIDGHTDSQGNREDNLELSRRRAESVAGMLIERGIPGDRIISRWHGERYPVTSNRTAQGRSQNRRVTIRLEKVGAPDVPPLASAGSK